MQFSLSTALLATATVSVHLVILRWSPQLLLLILPASAFFCFVLAIQSFANVAREIAIGLGVLASPLIGFLVFAVAQAIYLLVDDSTGMTLRYGFVDIMWNSMIGALLCLVSSVFLAPILNFVMFGMERQTRFRCRITNR